MPWGLEQAAVEPWGAGSRLPPRSWGSEGPGAAPGGLAPPGFGSGRCVPGCVPGPGASPSMFPLPREWALHLVPRFSLLLPQWASALRIFRGEAPSQASGRGLPSGAEPGGGVSAAGRVLARISGME